MASIEGGAKQSAQAPAKQWTKWIQILLICIGGASSAYVLYLAVHQMNLYGEYPPFTVTKNSPPNKGLSLGETGDFVGGWANSVALIWLVIVTVLQYMALNVQRQDLADTRKELEGQRRAMDAQVDLMEQHGVTSAGILKLEKSRAAVEFILEARSRLKLLLVEVVQLRSDPGRRPEVPMLTIRMLIDNVVTWANVRIDSTNKPHYNPTDIIDYANDTKEITNLFDAAVYYQQYVDDDKLYNGFMELKDVDGLYRTCEAIQRTAATLTK